MFLCHEALLRARSPVMDKMFGQKMKEVISRKKVLEDVQGCSIQAFLLFVYTNDIGPVKGNDAELIYLADKYEVPGLLELICRIFSLF